MIGEWWLARHIITDRTGKSEPEPPVEETPTDHTLKIVSRIMWIVVILSLVTMCSYHAVKAS